MKEQEFAQAQVNETKFSSIRFSQNEEVSPLLPTALQGDVPVRTEKLDGNTKAF